MAPIVVQVNVVVVVFPVPRTGVIWRVDVNAVGPCPRRAIPITAKRGSCQTRSEHGGATCLHAALCQRGIELEISPRRSVLRPQVQKEVSSLQNLDRILAELPRVPYKRV